MSKTSTSTDTTETTTVSEPSAPAPIIAYKGFDKDMSCRGFKFEIGGTYTQGGTIKACENGFHACEHPLNVFDYYPPASSRFAVVELSGDVDRDGQDTKVAARSIRVTAEVDVTYLVQAAFYLTWSRAKLVEGAASATGYQGAASATGKNAVAMASGTSGRAKASDGSAIFLVHRSDDGAITHVFAGIAGRDGLKPDTWYMLGDDGQPVEAA